MGGYGSSRWNHSTIAKTVDECRIISANRLVSLGVIGNGSQQGRLTWKSGAVIEYSVIETKFRFWIMELRYRLQGMNDDNPIILKLLLQTTSPNFGGVRWWMTCPLMKGNKPCRKRVEKLYRPFGKLFFGCRTCYKLTYQSCQESHKYDRVLQHMAMMRRISVGQLKRELKELREFEL
ncbi:MAG: hypothetical protein K2X66_18460 [Cyanobacteria bacterium]|nr:hypothetical protein [Cyanobacteriota bacterium]